MQPTAYRMDVWSETFLPGNIGLWLLVTCISRKVISISLNSKSVGPGNSHYRIECSRVAER